MQSSNAHYEHYYRIVTVKSKPSIMGFLDIFKSSYNKSKKIRDISKRLDQASQPTLDARKMMSQSSKKEEILDELFEVCREDKQLSKILEKHNASRKDLFKIYRVLISHGGGKWINGHYVAASVFAFAGTLDYCLSKELNSRENVLGMSFRMIEYFENGEVGFPKD